jgi:hypothetical protein
MDQHAVEELKKEVIILQKQLESKGVENKNLNEKCDIQSVTCEFIQKRINFLKK